jgi:hypothetical protein
LLSRLDALHRNAWLDLDEVLPERRLVEGEQLLELRGREVPVVDGDEQLDEAGTS